MAIRTPQQYYEGLRDGRVVYMGGKKVEDVTKDPIIGIACDWCAMDYVLMQDPRYQPLMTRKNEKGELESVLFYPTKTLEDLLRRREIIQVGSRICYGKCPSAKFTGIDALNALTVVSRRMDKRFGTRYTERVENFRRHLLERDYAVAAGMTDVKGNRTLRPAQQKPHQDYYVRIVDETDKGIVVRGAKAHISLAPVVDEIIVIPTRNMHEEDKDYAVAFAVSPSAKGITLIPARPDITEEDVGNFFDHPITASIYLADSMIIFDDVFVPNERVFMKREWSFAADYAYVFADFHRLSSDAIQAVENEMLLGMGALMAEYNGLERAPAIREMLTWLAMYAQITEALGRAACDHCITEPESGLVIPNPIYSNMSKLYGSDHYHQATKYVQDIAGGIVATIPSSKEWKNPETRKMMEKYLGGKDGIPTENRLKLINLIRDYASSYESVLRIHAEGSLAAQRLSVYNLADFERCKAMAKRAARIKDGTEHPLFNQLPDFPVRWEKK